MNRLLTVAVCLLLTVGSAVDVTTSPSPASDIGSQEAGAAAPESKGGAEKNEEHEQAGDNGKSAAAQENGGPAEDPNGPSASDCRRLLMSLHDAAAMEGAAHVGNSISGMHRPLTESLHMLTTKGMTGQQLPDMLSNAPLVAALTQKLSVVQSLLGPLAAEHNVQWGETEKLPQLNMAMVQACKAKEEKGLLGGMKAGQETKSKDQQSGEDSNASDQPHQSNGAQDEKGSNKPQQGGSGQQKDQEEKSAPSGTADQKHAPQGGRKPKSATGFSARAQGKHGGNGVSENGLGHGEGASDSHLGSAGSGAVSGVVSGSPQAAESQGGDSSSSFYGPAAAPQDDDAPSYPYQQPADMASGPDLSVLQKLTNGLLAGLQGHGLSGDIEPDHAQKTPSDFSQLRSRFLR